MPSLNCHASQFKHLWLQWRFECDKKEKAEKEQNFASIDIAADRMNMVESWFLQVRLQLETLLAEKSRLANENANLIRENQCLNQLVAYHQLTSQDLSESYEQVMQGMCLDFSSPPPFIAEEDEAEDGDGGAPATPGDGLFSFSTCLDGGFQQEEL